MKFILSFILCFSFVLTSQAANLLIESKSMEAKVFSEDNWCSPHATLDIKSSNDGFFNGDINLLMEKVKPVALSECSLIEKLTFTNSGSYVNEFFYDAQSETWKDSNVSNETFNANNETNSNEKIEEVRETVSSLDSKNVHSDANSNDMVLGSNYQSATKNNPYQNNGYFARSVILSIILFAFSVYLFLKIGLLNNITKARIVLLSTIAFSTLGIFYLFNDIDAVDPVYGMAKNSFFFSILIASIYSLFSWMFGIRFMLDGFRKLDSASTGDYQLIFEDFSNDVKKLNIQNVSLFVDESTDVVNAYAYTSIFNESIVVLNAPLIRLMSREEVRAIVLHELGHIKNNDSASMTLILMVKQAIDRIVLAPITVLKFALGAITATSWLRYFGQGGSIIFLMIFTFALMAIGYSAILVLVFMLPGMILDVFFNISAFKHSRNREFEADNVAKIEGFGSHLISALKKLHNSSEPVMLQSGQAKAFFGLPINNMTPSGITGVYSFASDSWLSPTKWVRLLKPELFSTHPDTVQRIERLERS